MNSEITRSIYKITGIAIGVILGVALLCSVVATIVVKTRSLSLIGRRVDVSYVYLNPITGSLSVQDLSCLEADTLTPFLHADRLHVRLNPLALIGKKLRISRISLTGLDVNIINSKNGFNFSDITARFSSDSTEVDTTSSAWTLDLNRIRLRKASVGYYDKIGNHHWQLDNLSLSVPHLGLGGEKTDAGVRLDLPNRGGTLVINGEYSEPNNTFKVEVKPEQLDIHRFLPFIQSYLNIRSVDATIDGHLLASGSLNDIAATRIRGELSLLGLDLKDHNRHSIALCDTCLLLVRNISLGTMQVDIDKLQLDGLRLDLRRTKDGNTLGDLLAVESTADSTQVVQESADDEPDGSDEPLTINGEAVSRERLHARIGRLSLNNGQIRYMDKTMPSDFKYQITDLNLQGTEIDTRSTSNHIVLNGSLPGGGTLMLNFRGGTHLETANARIVAMVRNAQLSDLSPWVESMFGYPVKSGTLSLSSDNSLIHGTLDATEVLNIYKPVLGKKRKRYEPKAGNIPLKMALDIMQDVKGNIELTVPVAGDVSSPEFRLSDVIGKALGQVFLKATAAPFLAMAKAKNKNIDLSQILIDPLEMDFQLDQYQKLDLIAEVMSDKQDIRLRLVQQFNLEDAIAQRALFDLKKEFYEKQTADKLGELTLVDIAKIRAIKNNNAEFQAYHKQVLSGKGTLTDKAIGYFGKDQLRDEVMASAEQRNEFVVHYLTEQKKLDKSRLSVLSMDQEQLLTYKGKPQYSVSAEMEE